MCGQQHEQMLMLVCMHDPCINCAAIHFCSTGASNSHSNVNTVQYVRRSMFVRSVGKLLILIIVVLWNCRESMRNLRYGVK